VLLLDAVGNVYITGYVSGAASFGALATAGLGAYNIFITKYNSDGTALWAQSAGGASYDDIGYGVALDAAGNVYLTGTFSGTATFGSAALGTLPSITSTGGSVDIYIAKYNSSGTPQWVQKAGGTGTDNVNAIVSDGNGNVYITGSFTGTAAFGALSTITSAGGQDIFIAIYNSSGTAQWVQKAGGTSVDVGTGITLDNGGNKYVVGTFLPSAQFGTQTFASGGTMFLTKLE
jgi:hypothetical protein